MPRKSRCEYPQIAKFETQGMCGFSLKATYLLGYMDLIGFPLIEQLLCCKLFSKSAFVALVLPVEDSSYL